MLDTNAYSGFMRGIQEVVDTLAHADEILVPVIVLGELRSGFRSGNREKSNLLELEEFLSSPRVTIQTIKEETSIFYAEVFTSLRSRGTPIPTNDLWIAAAALETGSILISRDAHFDLVPGLIRHFF